MQKEINYPSLPRLEPSAHTSQQEEEEHQKTALVTAPKPDLLTIWHKLREDRETFPKPILEEPQTSTREKEVVAKLQR